MAEKSDRMHLVYISSFAVGLLGATLFILLAGPMLRCVLAHGLMDVALVLLIALLCGAGVGLAAFLSDEVKRVISSLYLGVALVLVVYILVGSLAPGPPEEACVASLLGATAVQPAVRQATVLPASPTPTGPSLPAARPLLSPLGSPSPSHVPVPASPQPTVQTKREPPSNWSLYTVQRGESLSSLAWRYWTSAESLLEANCLKSYTVCPGQLIYVPNFVPRQSCSRPAGWLAYLVQRGDTLSSIARRVGTTVTALKQGNCLKSDRILAGAMLWVPGLPSSPPTSRPRPTLTRRPTSTPAPIP
jgi:LysM repeat protein